MLNFNSLVIGLLTVIAIAPTAQAFTPVATTAAIDQPATNLQADAAIIFGIKFPQPRSQPQPVVIIETPRQPEPIYREVSRDDHQEFSKHGHHGKHHKHHKGRGDKHNQYQRGNRHEDRHEHYEHRH
jgi:hypothetical protein